MATSIQTLIGRGDDLDYIQRTVAQGACCSIIGTSNLGKSALLRHLGELTPSDAGTFAYIDCNQMADHSARAFFAVAWRALAARLDKHAPDSSAAVRRWSAQLVHAPSALAAQTAFEEGLALALAKLPRPLVLCLDEFDQVYLQCEGQTFLNLRSLQDRYRSDLLYITATERELVRLTTTREQGEFYELVAAHIHYLSFWNPSDSGCFCDELAARDQITFDKTDFAFIYEQAGGHPGLTEVVCHLLGKETGAPVRDAHQNRAIHQLILPKLASDENVRSECDKIWDDLADDERQMLIDLPHVDTALPAWRTLHSKCILSDAEDGYAPFGKLFGDFIHQKKLKVQPNGRGVYIDVDAGTVWVDGKEIEALSELEYKLLLFLYGRLDRICDKYQIVETVWGQDYIDKVDDTRIEKLISRLRQKVEPDSAHPRYLQSVRGRGYKLVR